MKILNNFTFSQAEALPCIESIQLFYWKNKIPYNI